MAELNTVDLGVVADAANDARHLGAGYIRILPDGTMERVDPRTVQIHEDAPGYGDGLGMPWDR